MTWRSQRSLSGRSLNTTVGISPPSETHGQRSVALYMMMLTALVVSLLAVEAVVIVWVAALQVTPSMSCATTTGR